MNHLPSCCARTLPLALLAGVLGASAPSRAAEPVAAHEPTPVPEVHAPTDRPSVDQTPEPPSAPASEATYEAAAHASPEGIVPLVDYTGDLSKRLRLSGDWGGLRTDIAQRGVMFDLDSTNIVQGVVQGGRRIDWDFGGSFDIHGTFDFHRMKLLPGAVLSVRAETKYGESVNDDSGLLLPVNSDGYFPLTVPGNEAVFAVTEVLFTQMLAPTFGLMAGKFQTLDADPSEWASGRGTTQFMNINFMLNGVGALTVPYSTLGGGLLWLPTDSIAVSSACFASTDSSTTSGFNTLDDGWTWSTEADFQYKLFGQPGGCNLGGIYSFGKEFNEVGGKYQIELERGLVFATNDSTWAFYGSVWQYLFSLDPVPHRVNPRDGRADLRGLGLFARVGVADDQTNPMPWSVSVGLGGRGLIPTRDDDTFGVAYAYCDLVEPGHPVGRSIIEDSTQMVEGYYNIAITPAMGLSLDIQWVDTAFRSFDPALIVGMRLTTRF